MSKKQLKGVIVSLANDKTAQVEVSRQWQHPLYLKRVTRTKKYACHYENMELAVGDQVVIEETKPMSKTKHYRVLEKVTAEAK